MCYILYSSDKYFIIKLSNIIRVIYLFYFVGTVQVLYNLSIVKSVLALNQERKRSYLISKYPDRYTFRTS